MQNHVFRQTEEVTTHVNPLLHGTATLGLSLFYFSVDKPNVL